MALLALDEGTTDDTDACDEPGAEELCPAEDDAADEACDAAEDDRVLFADESCEELDGCPLLCCAEEDAPPCDDC